MEEEVKYCKNCKRDISAKNYVIHTAYCERKIQLCGLCSEPVPRSELENHEKEFHSKITCSECGISVEKWQVEKHKVTCEKRLVPCEYCELELPLDNLSEHGLACGSRTELCSKCNKHVMLKDLVKHPRYCSKKESEAVLCEHCGNEINWNEFMGHIILCGTRTERCSLCNEHIMVKDKVTHSISCKKSLSKIYGDCSICHQSIPWIEMNVHSAFCAHVNSEINEYELQNKFNELTLENESEIWANKISDEKKSQLAEDQKRCLFCFENFPCYDFAQHLKICQERPYNCDECLKPMPYRNKEMHDQSCLDRRRKALADDNILHGEETDDNKVFKKFKKCQFCELRFPDVLFQDHLKKCELREEKRMGCLENVPVKDMPDHKLLKCNFAPLAENRNFNDRNKMYAETTPKPSKNIEGKEYLEKFVEICPLCKCKIPEERYDEHLLLCYAEETLCHFCHNKILKRDEHLHYRGCYKILQSIDEDNNSQSKKKKGNINKGKSIPERVVSWFNSQKRNSFERNNNKQVSQVSDSWQSNTGRSYETDNITPVCPSTIGLNEANELPCEFCDQMWPAEFLIEHESGCRPDLVSFPKTEEGNGDQKCPTFAATASQNLHTPVLGASPKSIREKDNEWKVQSRKSNKASSRESIDHRKNDKNLPKKLLNAKEKFFYYPSQDTDDVPKIQNGNLKKKRYSQVRENQETFKTKPDKEIGEKKDDSTKDEFTSFRFSTSRFNMELQNTSISRKENDDVLSTDVKNYDETKKSENSYDLRDFSAESSPMVDCSKSNFNREIRPVGAERTERKRFMHSSKDVDTNEDFKEIPVQKLNDDVLSTDVKNYDETKKSENSYDLRDFSAESSPMVNCSKSNFNREIRPVGAERTERKRIMHSSKDVDTNEDFKEIPVQKLITFDANNKTGPLKFLENTESRTFNLSVPAIWNTEDSLSSEKFLRNHVLKSFGNDNEAKDHALFNAVEIEHLALNLNMEETDYDGKNNETFGSGFMESINNNQTEENENGAKSERSNSDDTFYDADDGGAKYFDAVNDNFHGNSDTQENKLSLYNFDNLNFNNRNQKENINPSNHVDSNADVRLEEEDLIQKDCDLGGYFQFLHKGNKQSKETQRMLNDVGKFFYETAGDCKCGNKECCCEHSSSIQKASSQPCTFIDTADSGNHSEPMDIEPLLAEAKTSHKMKSKKSLEFSSKKNVENEDID